MGYFKEGLLLNEFLGVILIKTCSCSRVYSISPILFYGGLVKFAPVLFGLDIQNVKNTELAKLNRRGYKKISLLT